MASFSELETSRLIDKLRSRSAWLATAESCTGGLVASLITDIAGASDVFWGASVVYDNSAKLELGVSAELLAQHGAVSEAVARALSEAALRRMTAAHASSPPSYLAGRPARERYALSTTGIAGPGGATAAKPVGLCWIALSGGHFETRALRIETQGLDRVANKAAFARAALQLLADSLA